MIKNRLGIVLFVSLAAICFLLVHGEARAERCEMVGCPGIYYIFLPDEGHGPIIFQSGRQRCTPAEDVQTFVEPGLPAVNAIATLKQDNRGLYSEVGIEGQIDQFQPPSVDPESNSRTGCVVRWSEPEYPEGSPESGTKLRILGYRTFLGHRTVTWPATAQGPSETRTNPQQLLFALVTLDVSPPGQSVSHSKTSHHQPPAKP